MTEAQMMTLAVDAGLNELFYALNITEEDTKGRLRHAFITGFQREFALQLKKLVNELKEDVHGKFNQ
jgi:hypothetical protein